MNTNTAIQKPGAVMLNLQQIQTGLLEQAAQNLSNAGTNGYKSFNTKLVEARTKSPEGETVSYVKVESVQRDLTSGPVRFTRSPFDFAITGRGYFMVQTPGGVRYSRNGQFQIDAEGRLTTVQGYPILNDGGGDIIIQGSPRDLAVSSTGQMTVNGEPIGKIGVVTFEDEQKMRPQGFTLFASDEEALPATEYFINHGALEESNVSLMAESVNLIKIHRLFDHAQKLIEEYDQLQRKTINVSSKN
jgi:flagellar basal-body rod protein FlgF